MPYTAAPFFDTPIDETNGFLIGPWRKPRQMLSHQSVDGRATIHDDGTAQKLGFSGGTIEGPTHFSLIAPLATAVWGKDFFEQGSISAHYQQACFEGDETRAILQLPQAGATQTQIRVERRDGVNVLTGTVSLGKSPVPSALAQRLNTLPKPGKLIILRDVPLNKRGRRHQVRMDMKQNMGAFYPFSLADKLRKITEYSPSFEAHSSPWLKPVIPFEMISVLLNYTSDVDPFPIRGPVVSLFLDQEIELIKGPLFAEETYEIDREVVAFSESRRTESQWVLTRVYQPGSQETLARMLLNIGSFKSSYANYEVEAASMAG